jgi:hypothetical protein
MWKSGHVAYMGKNEKFIQKFYRKISREETTWET